MKELMFLNRKFLPIEEACVSASSPGFLLGWGLFETMRSYKNKIIYFDQHIKRILDSCRLICINPPYPAAKLKSIIAETISINGFKDSYVRLTLSKSGKSTVTHVTAKKYTPYAQGVYRRGFSTCVTNFRQDADSLFSRLKTTSRISYELALTEAKKKGFDEGLILNNNGYIAEGTRSNIFLVKEKMLFTPSVSCGCLEGITRRVIFVLAGKYKINIREGNFTIQDLYNAQEAFLTNSLMGVMPLSAVEKEKIGKGGTGLAKFFIEKYNSMLK